MQPPSGERPAKLSLGRPYRRSERQRAPEAQPSCSEDTAVRATDTDALGSRISALDAGYLPPDPYAHLLAGDGTPPARRPLLINIGTALRSRHIDLLVDAFLASGRLPEPGAASLQAAAGALGGATQPVQVLSLGAGSDTRFWRIAGAPQTGASLARYVEVDFAEMARAKADQIRRTPALASRVAGLRAPEAGSELLLEGDQYKLLGLDLRTLAAGGAPAPPALEQLMAQLDPAKPTLVLLECVLAYMNAGVADAALSAVLSRLGSVGIVLYDMCVSGEAGQGELEPSRFGQVMLHNLSMRHLTLPGARAYTTSTAYAERLRRLLHGARRPPPTEQVQSHALSLRALWLTLDASERQRYSRQEGLDEVEELEMLLAHYCLCWAWRA